MCLAERVTLPLFGQHSTVYHLSDLVSFQRTASGRWNRSCKSSSCCAHLIDTVKGEGPRIQRMYPTVSTTNGPGVWHCSIPPHARRLDHGRDVWRLMKSNGLRARRRNKRHRTLLQTQLARQFGSRPVTRRIQRPGRSWRQGQSRSGGGRIGCQSLERIRVAKAKHVGAKLRVTS